MQIRPNPAMARIGKL